MANDIMYNGSLVYLHVGKNKWYLYDSSAPPLGSGAMGTVYMGFAVDNRYDRVAIKLVNPRYASVPAVRERAKLEASLQFRHPNLVEMLGFCTDDNPQGPMYIVSRLVRGENIDRYAKAFDGSPDRVQHIVRAMLPVLDALDFIHAHGIIHLDVKPSNIMIEDGRTPRLMDLGIAFTQDAMSTTQGGLLGTPGYAAPEQYLKPGMTRLPLGASTDVFEAGATIYELLAGRKPYDHNKQVLALIQDVPEPVMQVIATSLALDRNQRYSTAREFKLALESALNAPPPTIWDKGLKTISSWFS